MIAAVFPAMRVRDVTALWKLEGLDYVALIGASGSGKTTLARAVRKDVRRMIGVPPRLTTRGPRGNEDPEEYVQMSAEGIRHGASNGSMLLAWEKQLPEGRTEMYAFSRSGGPALPWLLSANDALWLNRQSVWPPTVLDARTLWVRVECSPQTRAERLRKRSPELFRDNPAEAAFRLIGPGEDLGRHMHLTVINDGDYYEATAPGQFTEFIRRVCEARLGR